MNIKEYVKTISEKYKDKPIVVFDLETTGLDPNNDEIIQFCGIRIEKGKTKELTFLCKPSKPIPKIASDIHGITDEKVKDCKLFKDYADDIEKLFTKAIIVGYNSTSFDVPFIKMAMAKIGNLEFIKDNELYDAFLIYKKHHTRKLADALKFYTNQDIENAHDALGDVKTTIAIAAAQIEKENADLQTIYQKLEINKQKDELDRFIEIVNDRAKFTFSKNKGQFIEDVDSGFIQWIIKNDFPQKLKDFINKYLKDVNSRKNKKSPVRA